MARPLRGGRVGGVHAKVLDYTQIKGVDHVQGAYTTLGGGPFHSSAANVGLQKPKADPDATVLVGFIPLHTTLPEKLRRLRGWVERGRGISVR